MIRLFTLEHDENDFPGVIIITGVDVCIIADGEKSRLCACADAAAEDEETCCWMRDMVALVGEDTSRRL